MNVFELEATLTLKTTDYDRALSEAGSSAKDAGRSITDGFSGVEKEFENIGESISDSFSSAFDVAESRAADAGSSIADSLADAGESFADAGSSAQEAGAEISDGMSEAGEETGNAGRSIKDVLSSIGNAFSEAGSNVLNFGKSIVSSVVPGFDSIASAASGGVAMLGGLAGAAIAVGKSLVDAATSAAAFADDILTLSSTTGLSTDTLQEFKYMEDLIDVSVNTVASSMRRLTNNMDAAANGSTTASEAFEKLGVSVKDSEGHLRSTEEVFYAVINALGEVGNHAERDAIAMDLFGKSAMDLNPMIDAGSEKLSKLAQEAHEVGYVLSSSELSNLGGLQDSFDRLGKSSEALANNLGEKVAPAIQDFVDGVTGAMNNLNNALDDPEWASDMAGSPIVTFLSTLFGTWKSGAEDAEEATEEAIETLDGIDDSAQSAADAAAEFAAAWQEAFESAAEAAASTFSTFEQAPQIVAGSAEQVIASLVDMSSALQSQKKYWDDYADNIRTAMERGVDHGLVQSLSDGSAESARQLAQLATATDEEIASMNAAYEEQQAAIENYATAVADAATGVTTATDEMASASESMETAFTTATSNVESAAQTMADTVATSLQGAAADARSAGEMVGQGFADGIASKVDEVKAAVESLTNAARTSFTVTLDIHSPSRVTRRLGEYTGAGFAEGIADTAGDTRRAARDMANCVIDTVTDVMDIHSPSRVMETLGENTVQGYADGIDANAGAPVASMTQVMDETRMVGEGVIRIPGQSVFYMAGQYMTRELEIGIQDNADAVYDAAAKIQQGVYEILVEGRGSNHWNTDNPQVTASKLTDIYLNGLDDAESRISLRLAQTNTLLWEGLQQLAAEANRTIATVAVDSERLIVEGGRLGIQKEMSEWEKFLLDGGEVTAKNVEKIAEQAYDYGTEQIRKLSKYQELSVGEEIALWEELQAQFIEGSEQWLDAQDQLDDLYYQQRKEREQAIRDGFESIEDAQEDFYQAAQDFEARVADCYAEIDRLQAEYFDAVENRTAELANTWGMFGEVALPDPEEAATAADLIKNLEGQVAALEEYGDTLESLAERGLDDAILEGLKGAGPNNMEILRALRDSTDEELDTIVTLWGEKMGLAADQAVKELEPLKDETNEKISEQIDEINRLYEEEAPGAIQTLDDALSGAFADGLPETMAAAEAAAQGVLDTIESVFGVSWNGEAFEIKTVAYEDSAIGAAATRTTTAVAPGGTGETNVTVEFTGELAALGRVLQPVVRAEDARIGSSLVNV